MKRSATLSVIALIAMPALALPAGCGRSNEPAEEIAAPPGVPSAPTADRKAGTDAPGTTPELRVERAAAGRGTERGTERGAGEPTVLVATAPREATAADDPLESPRSGFAGRREPWREQIVGATSPIPTELTEDLIDACLDVARDIDSALADRLALLRKKNPAQLEATLRKTERLYSLALLKRRDADLYGLKLIELEADREIVRLTKEYREAILLERDPGEIGQQLRTWLRLQLAFEYRNREDHLCKLRELIEQLEIEFEAEKAYLEEHADDVVEERLREIIGAIEPPPPE